jgi:hypothetical protein
VLQAALAQVGRVCCWYKSDCQICAAVVECKREELEELTAVLQAALAQVGRRLLCEHIVVCVSFCQASAAVVKSRRKRYGSSAAGWLVRLGGSDHIVQGCQPVQCSGGAGCCCCCLAD